jgi:phage terminase small subunit
MKNDNSMVPANELTIKQEKYAQALFSGLSQRDAYNLAYDCKNMTDSVIDVKACELANNGKIVVRVNQLTEILAAKNAATVEKVIKELAKIGFADIKQYLQYKTAKTVIDHDSETGEPIIDYKQIVDVIDSDQVDGSVIQEISISKDGTFKFKLYDKLAALEKIGKHLGMFTEKSEVNNIHTIGLEQSLLDMIKRKNQD